ncbi:MAG: GGDEF domain-containing protein [Vampirovibrionales bacterium]|nr:GGDEF domain-containing protein [Vampirovibrionales bacterium]
MLDIFLKQGFRLNRLLGFANGFFILIAIQAYATQQTPFHWFSQGVPLAFAVLASLAFMLINEIGLKTFKTLHRSDNIIQDKLSVALPLVTTAYLCLQYILLAQVGTLLLMVFSILSAQLMGHPRLARGAAGFLLLLFSFSLLLGYPDLLPLGVSPLSRAAPTVEWLLQVTPFILILLYYHQATASTLYATHDKMLRLQSLAATDGLTGLINRRQFNHQLHSEIARARRHKKPLSLALFDIDDFKKINDMYGHPVGDRILKELGQLVLENVRESDTPARYGGEEFALILPETRQAEAYELLERLRALVEKTVFCLPDNPITATISVGVAQLDAKELNAFDLVEISDTALYEAKKQGKNRVVYGVVPTPKIQVPGKSASFKLHEAPAS